MVIGYPNYEKSIEVAELYINKNIEILEVQIPFSHPTADGAILTQANQQAVEQGITLQKSFYFLQNIRKNHPQQVIMAMTYINKVFSMGVENFCNKMEELRIPHLIIPDLPFDSTMAKIIHKHPYCQQVPVLAANISDERLEIALSTHPQYVYLMADFKITGQNFSIHQNIQNLINKIRNKSEAKIGLGFGISNVGEVTQALRAADFAIIGSSLAKAIQTDTLVEKVNELTSIH